MDQQVDLEELDLDDTDEETERPPSPSPIVCHLQNSNPQASSVSNCNYMRLLFSRQSTMQTTTIYSPEC